MPSNSDTTRPVPNSKVYWLDIERLRRRPRARSRRLWTALFIGVIAWMLLGCASQTPHSLASPPVPANLLVKCQPLLPLDDGIAGTILRKLAEVSAAYYECADRHNATVNALKSQ